MTDNRRRPKRGVTLDDLPKCTRDKVLRDLPEFEPEHGETILVHRDGRTRKPGRRGGIERLQHSFASTPLGKATVAALKSGTIEKAVRGAIKQATTGPKKLPTRRQKAAAEFDMQLRQRGYKLGSSYVREHKFAKEDAFEARAWRFDFALPRYMLAIEIEGLVVRMVRDINTHKPMRVVTGRHATITGMRQDFHKYAAAEILGWHVIRVEQDMIANGDAIGFVERFVAAADYRRQQAKPTRRLAGKRRTA